MAFTLFVPEVIYTLLARHAQRFCQAFEVRTKWIDVQATASRVARINGQLLKLRMAH